MQVSVVVVAYGESPLLAECVDALLASRNVDPEVIVVDNGAAPAVLDDVAARGARVVGDGANLGFGGGCNLGAADAKHDVVAFVNPDAVVQPDALARLAQALERDPALGIASARVRLYRQPELLNSAGGAIHFLGLGWAEEFEQPLDVAAAPKDIAAASGAAMAMRKADFDALGGFTDEFFLYHEDAELSLRCLHIGKSVRYLPDADVLHDYAFSRNAKKLYYLERNRLILVLTCYQARTLALLALPLLALEVGMLALSVAQGWTKEKAAGWGWLVAHRGWLRAHRRRVQSQRTVPDRRIAHLLSPRFQGGQVAFPDVLRPADRLLALYWRAVKPLL